MADFRTPVIERLGAQLADLAAENARLRQQLDAVTKERDVLRPVYETWWNKVGTLDGGEELSAKGYMLLTIADDQAMCDACDAVDAWRAAQPDQKGPTAAPPSTVNDERAGWAPGDACPTCNSLTRDISAAKCDNCGNAFPIPSLTDDERAAWVDMTLDNTQEKFTPAEPLTAVTFAPTDPAGLDAAIEAAISAIRTETPAAYRARGISWTTVARTSVRAAAPHLVRGERRAALLEAADALPGGEIRDWLRERAEREATGG